MGSPNIHAISNCFDQLHTYLGLLRVHFEALDDEEVMELFFEMETGTLAPMRELRKKLNIPFEAGECTNTSL